VTPVRHQEIERQYDVDPTTALPSLTSISGVASSGQQVAQDLVATYFDTPGLDLARHGITLRRRTGGDDAGWHVKLPVGKSERTEVRLPLGGDVSTVPAELVHPVRAIVRDQPLLPVATVTNHRLRYDLLDESGTVLAQVCDDDVHAERLVGQTLHQHWREWEVELVDGVRGVLNDTEEQLLAAGATRARAGSKLLRALADAAPTPERRPGRSRLARGSAELLLRHRLLTQVAVVHRQDARLRAGLPGSVHKLRIALRRIRSALTTYRPVLVPGSVDPLREELRWLGQCLSEARDAQVIHGRLRHLLADEAPELVLGPVLSRVERGLADASQQGREGVLAALDSERYYRLLDLLDGLVRSLPSTARGQQAASAVLPELLQRDVKRLRRAVRRVHGDGDAHARDAALHDARKKAKRLRYAAETAVPVFGRRATRLAASAKAVQESLGEHQDSVVTRERLREYAVQAHLNGENGFTFGRLHALEQWRAHDTEVRFATAWKHVPRRRLARYLRG
jgi:CHAD domain-containing protein